MKKFLFLLMFFGFLLTSCNLFSPEHFDGKEVCNVTYMIDGNVYHSTSVKEDSKTTFPMDPEKDGYVFLGWFSLGDKWEEHDTVTSSMILTAKFRECEYYDIVLFVDGYVYDILNVQENSILEEPKAPVKEDYKFIGWYCNGTLFDFSTKMTGPLYLEAQYEYDGEKIVNFIVDDYIYHSEIFRGDLILKEMDAPVKEGANFVGWFINNEILWKPGEPISESVDIYARYEYYGNVNIYYYVDGNLYHHMICPRGDYAYDFVPAVNGEFIGWFNGDEPWNFSNRVYTDLHLEARYINDVIVSICDVLAWSSGSCIIEGHVVGTHGYGFVVYDGSAAIYVYTKTETGLSVGDIVNVRGEVSSYQGTSQIVNPSYSVIGQGSIYTSGMWIDAGNFSEFGSYCGNGSACLETIGVLESYSNGYRIYVGDHFINITSVAHMYDYLVGKVVRVTGYSVAYNSRSIVIVVTNIKTI